MKKRFLILSMAAVVVFVSAGMVLAQGDGNGGRGSGGAGNGDQIRNQYGVVDIVEPETSEIWYRNRDTARESASILQYTMLAARVEGDLPEAVNSAMVSGLNDERIAYAMYESIMEQFGKVAPFVNIADAEARHMSTWEFMFEQYGVELPPMPEIDIPQFATVRDACQYAIDAEIANRSLYDDMLATFADYPDLTQVTLALRNASDFNHLPALERCVG
jgi:rubrerythrin